MTNQLANQGFSDWPKHDFRKKELTREERIDLQIRRMTPTDIRSWFADDWSATNKDGGLPRYRRQRGLTQEDFSRIATVNLRTLQRIEGGTQVPQHVTIEHILGAMMEIELCLQLFLGGIKYENVDEDARAHWETVGFDPIAFVKSWPNLTHDGKKVNK